MERWIPLMEIFLNSPCPETEASLWLRKSFNHSSNSAPISTTSFLSLLAKPSGTILIDPSPPAGKRVMWIKTLPSAVQARILSFLAYDSQRFCQKDLCKLARKMLSDGKGLDFWVKKTAQQLLDIVSISNYQWLSHLNSNLGSEDENGDDEFLSVPDWLRDAAKESESLLPWLPISPDEFSLKLPFFSCGEDGDDFLNEVEEDKQENLDEMMVEDRVNPQIIDGPMDPEVENKAKSLKARLLDFVSTSKAVELAKDIRQLCVERGKDSLAVMALIEPWNAEDETAAVLVSHLLVGSEGDELGWPSQVLCSIVLPKLLLLNQPASGVLVAATIEYCKAHQRAAEYAFLFPLILRNEGLNNPVCDVITRVVKECLHPAHVSAFCQKLLWEDINARKFICLPCHQCLISEKIVWTESLFNLLQSILNHNVHLTEDSVEQLIHRVYEFSERYSKSLKFGNFILCLIGKYAPLLKPHKVLLTEAVENTNTLVTKSILAKLSSL
ncbi:Fanconi anemia group E protein [Abeliophyllum distichum]|uniref:Fanconi anemia group E protein n=1 Tax=Abeliophyllum distichum TaxID=126358 RepID=A0ABD1V7A1_9LAMI